MKLIQFINRYAHTVGVFNSVPELAVLEFNARGRQARKDSVAQIRDLSNESTMTYFFPQTDVTAGVKGSIVYDGATQYMIFILRKFLSVYNKVGIRISLYLRNGVGQETQIMVGYINCTEAEFEAELNQLTSSNVVPYRDIVSEKVYISDTAIVNGDGATTFHIALTVDANLTTPDSFTLELISDTSNYTPVTLAGVGMWPFTSVTTATLDPAIIAQLSEMQESIDTLEQHADNMIQEYVKR